jgi:hypothetical protein
MLALDETRTTCNDDAPPATGRTPMEVLLGLGAMVALGAVFAGVFWLLRQLSRNNDRTHGDGWSGDVTGGGGDVD